MKALSQFMLMCISSDSKYDKVMRGEDNAKFSASEAEGYATFKQKCASCHSEPLFTDESFRNNGIGKTLADDKGRYEITLNPGDEYKFKVPSLRNLKYTTPYMHNGTFITLEAVLDHYSSGVKDSETLDPGLKQNGATGIALTSVEKQHLLAFLGTLNDESFLNKKILSEQ
ncbi:MAG: cytochrome-c peroxidase, partial [Pedobacter sp.]